MACTTSNKHLCVYAMCSQNIMYNKRYLLQLPAAWAVASVASAVLAPKPTPWLVTVSSSSVVRAYNISACCWSDSKHILWQARNRWSPSISASWSYSYEASTFQPVCLRLQDDLRQDFAVQRRLSISRPGLLWIWPASVHKAIIALALCKAKCALWQALNTKLVWLMLTPNTQPHALNVPLMLTCWSKIASSFLMSALAICTSPKTPANMRQWHHWICGICDWSNRPYQEQEEALHIAATDANPTCSNTMLSHQSVYIVGMLTREHIAPSCHK